MHDKVLILQIGLHFLVLLTQVLALYFSGFLLPLSPPNSLSWILKIKSFGKCLTLDNFTYCNKKPEKINS